MSPDFARLLASADPRPREDFARWGLRRVEHTARFVARHLPAGHALDVSSGPHFAYLMALATPGIIWSHTDHDGTGDVAFTDKGSGEPLFHYRPTPYRVAPDSPPPSGGPYDAVTSWEVVEHLDFNPGLFFATLGKSLRPGGLLMLSTPNVGGLSPQFHAARGASPYQTPFFPRAPWHHTREYGVHEIKQLLLWAGFEAVRLETRDCYRSDIRGWRKFVRRSCAALAGLLTVDPAAVRHAIRYSGSTQFWCAKRVREPGPVERLPPV